MARDMVLVGGVRTPIGSFGGSLKSFSGADLGVLVTRELLSRTGIDPAKIDEVYFGCVSQSSDAPNLARVVSLKSGIPITTPGMTVARNCASGLQAIVSACQAIKAEDGEVYLVGGCESMSTIPFILRDMRWGHKLRNSVAVDGIWEGLTDPVCGEIMGKTAENLAQEFSITREEQDKFASSSHSRAFRARRMGKFNDETVTVTVSKMAAGREVATEPFKEDEGINPALSAQILAQYPPMFDKAGGTVTAGNSCPLSDGAAATLVMTETRARDLGLQPLAFIRSYAFFGVEPSRMGIGPVGAIRKAVDRAGLKLSDIQLVEINEAFAAQYLACEKELGLDRKIVNVNGGAIALGHPVGSTGTRLTIALAYEMQRNNLQYGVASMCIGGGQGGAIVLERVRN